MKKIYKYSELKGVIKVGDEVRAVLEKRNGCAQLNNHGLNTKKITYVGQNSFNIDGCDHGYYDGHYLEIINQENNNKNIMTQTNIIAKEELNQNIQDLIKTGYLNSDLSLTDKGREASDELQFLQNKPALVKLAQEELSEPKDESEDQD